jgi:O-antigen/teichoic acid export membrane protein
MSGFRDRENNQIDERIRNLTRGISSLIVQNIITILLGFVFLGALLRLLPAVDYGGYSGVQVSVAIATPIVLLGLQYAAARYVSLKDQEDWIRRARSVLKLSLLTTTLAPLLFALLAPYLSLYYMKTTSFADLFELGALWLFSISISTIFQAFVQGLKMYTALAKILLVSRAAMVAFTIIGLLLSPNVLISIVAWTIYSGIIVAWGLSILGREFFRAEGEKALQKQNHYSEILRYSLQLGIASIFVFISSYADVVIVGGYLGPISLAIYQNGGESPSFSELGWNPLSYSIYRY